MRRLARLASAALIGSLLCAPAALAATVRVLFRSGDAATDGVRIDALENPIATTPTDVVFRGGTSAILLRSGDGFAAVARTGDPLPPPLTGTFNDLRDALINDRGTVAFRAGLNSPDRALGFFLYEAGILIPLASVRGSVLRAPLADINGDGDLLLPGSKTIDVWRRATTMAIRLVRNNNPAPGGKFRRFGPRAVLNDAGAVVFEAQFTAPKTKPR